MLAAQEDLGAGVIEPLTARQRAQYSSAISADRRSGSECRGLGPTPNGKISSVKYSNAPIVEAVIDFRVRQRSDFSLTDLEPLTQSEGTYPERKDVRLGTGTLDLDSDTPASGSVRIIGRQFWSADKRRAFQATELGFNCSRLAPYAGWEDLRDEAKRLWRRYRDLARPEGITRLGVRYINRLDLPAPADLDLYLSTKPVLGPALPQGIEGWFMQLQIPSSPFAVVLTEGRAPAGPSSESVGIMLDIDVATGETSDSDEAVWPTLERMRECKNKFFEGSITDALRRRIA